MTGGRPLSGGPRSAYRHPHPATLLIQFFGSHARAQRGLALALVAATSAAAGAPYRGAMQSLGQRGGKTGAQPSFS